jgi:glycopeptide antibiotics resistance protein
MKKGMRKNMSKISSKIIKENLLILISVVIVGFNLVIDIIPNLMLDTKMKLITYIFSMILVFIDMKIKCKKFSNKEQYIKRGLTIIFIIYSILISTLLFVDGNYRRFGSNVKIFSKEHFEYYSNLIPFRTIYAFLSRIVEGTINLNAVLTNILGNIIVFAPYGILVPIIFKDKFDNVKNFILLMIGTVFIVECIQFITMNGALDIDDLILNVLGAVIMYGLMKVKIIKQIVYKIIGKELE